MKKKTSLTYAIRDSISLRMVLKRKLELSSANQQLHSIMEMIQTRRSLCHAFRRQDGSWKSQKSKKGSQTLNKIKLEIKMKMKYAINVANSRLIQTAFQKFQMN